MLSSILYLFSLPLMATADHRSGEHWARTSNPMTLGVIKSIDNSGGNNWLEHFDWALDVWSQSDSLNLVSVPGNTDAATRQNCPEEDGYIRVCNGNYGVTPWRGKAEWSYWIEDGHEGHIKDCIVRLNDYDTTQYEKKWLCHEIGHCLGLGHTSTNGNSDGSCMDYSVEEESLTPSNADYQVLSSVYDHVDDYDTPAFVESDGQDNEEESVECDSGSYIWSLEQECACSEKTQGQPWKDEDEYVKCVEDYIKDSNQSCDVNQLIGMMGCLPFPDAPEEPANEDPPENIDEEEPLVCTQDELESLAEVCDCDEKKPGKPWKDEAEYTKCVSKAVKDSEYCNEQQVIDEARCLPFQPALEEEPEVEEPEEEPEVENEPEEEPGTCGFQELQSLAQVCDCSEKKPGKPWKSEDEYKKCVTKAVKNSDFCTFSMVLNAAACLPFASTPTDAIPSDNQQGNSDCSSLTSKDECKGNKNTCKWKKNTCIDKNRRMEGEGYLRRRTEDPCADPIEFDIPAEAILKQSNAHSCTFTLRVGDKVTVYDILLEPLFWER